MLWMVLLLEVYFRYVQLQKAKNHHVEDSFLKWVNETVCVVMFVFCRVITDYFINHPTTLYMCI